MTDTEFRLAAKTSLGITTCNVGSQCQHRYRSEGREDEVCGTPLDAKGRHAMTCKVQGQITLTHNRVCNILARMCTKAGMQALREQLIPELRGWRPTHRKVMDAVADVDARGPGSIPRLLLDASIRYPDPKAYPGSDEGGGVAANAAEKEKADEYQRVGGLVMEGAGMETFGRFGKNLCRLIAELHKEARERTLPQPWDQHALHLYCLKSHQFRVYFCTIHNTL